METLSERDRKKSDMMTALEILSEKLNFRMHVTFTSGENISHYITQPGPRPFHLYDFYGFLRVIDYAPPMPYDTHSISYLVPPGESLTALEKILLPFDTSTWLWISMTFAAAFCLILLVNIFPQEVSAAVFGSENGSRYMNFLNIICCGGQTRVPNGNFARFLLLLFLLWALVICTGYQSLSYRMLQLDLRHPAIDSYEKLDENKFTELTLYNLQKIQQERPT